MSLRKKISDWFERDQSKKNQSSRSYDQSNPNPLPFKADQTPSQDPSIQISFQDEQVSENQGRPVSQHEHNGREESSVQPTSENISVMREFLEAGVDFSWPSGLGHTAGSHCDITTDWIPFKWMGMISDRSSATIDVYKTPPSNDFGVQRPFAVKTIRDANSEGRRHIAMEVSRLKNLRHPHMAALLGTFSYKCRLSIMTFPAATCSLHDIMGRISRDIRDVRDQIKQFPALGQVVTPSDGRTPSTSSQGSRHGSGAIGYPKPPNDRQGRNHGVWPLNTLSEYDMDILRRCFVCLSQALSYLHESSVRHRDIKPTNILIDESGSVLLADLGTYDRFPKHIPYDSRTDRKYTRKYASPEEVTGHGIPSGYSSDVFSLGCVLIEVATLLLGYDLTKVIKPSSIVVNELSLDDAYHCNLGTVQSWILFLKESQANERAPFRLNQIPRNKGQATSSSTESSTTAALICIRSMLDVDPQARPIARNLWISFRSISSRICPDCDARHPQVWRSNKGPDKSIGLDILHREDAGRISHDTESEVSSIVSVTAPSIFTDPTLSSKTSIAEIQGAPEEFAKVLLADEVLEPLYVAALHRIDIEKLERNLARLLRSYAKDLRVEAITDLERTAVKFARRYAQSVAYHLCKSLDLSKNLRYVEMHLLSAQDPRNEENIEQYLRQVADYSIRGDGPDATEALPGSLVKPTFEHSDDSGSDEADRPGLSNLIYVENFMTKSKAFARFRENFRAFVAPVSEDKDQGRPNQELADEHLATVSNSDDSKEATENGEEKHLDQELTEDHVDPTPNSDDFKETSDTNSNTTESSETQLSNISIAFEESIKAPWYVRSCKFLKGLISLAAEFSEFWEKPLEKGVERVRWTCVCGRKLYDDFYGVSPDAIEELRNYLDCLYGSTGRISTGSNFASQAESQPSECLSSNPALSASQPIGVASPSPGKSPQDGSPDGLRRLRRHRASGCLRESYDLQSSSRWIFPIFQMKRHGTKLIHIPVGVRESDESLFLALNRHYSQSTNKLVRYLSLRGVVKIHYVKFVFARRGPDIKETNNWPPQRHCPPWTYKGCPAKKKDVPLVGQSLLMHLWQFPSHADRQSYHSHRFGSSRVARHILCYLQSMLLGKSSGRWRGRAEEDSQRHYLGNAEGTRGNTILPPIAAVGADVEMANSSHDAVLRDPETQAENKSSSYIFLRTPKKLGDKLLPNDVDPPEGWGMYFEEGLKVSRLFMFILFLYLSGTLVFAIVWYRAFGMAGPQSGFGAFGVSGWMVGLMSIITTVWFKWAE